MKAWYFATALAKRYDDILPFIENHSLDEWSHNKAIQKAIESYRVSREHKEYLRTLKIKIKKVINQSVMFLDKLANNPKILYNCGNYSALKGEIL